MQPLPQHSQRTCVTSHAHPPPATPPPPPPPPPLTFRRSRRQRRRKMSPPAGTHARVVIRPTHDPYRGEEEAEDAARRRLMREGRGVSRLLGAGSRVHKSAPASSRARLRARRQCTTRSRGRTTCAKSTRGSTMWSTTQSCEPGPRCTSTSAAAGGPCGRSRCRWDGAAVRCRLEQASKRVGVGSPVECERVSAARICQDANSVGNWFATYLSYSRTPPPPPTPLPPSVHIGFDVGKLYMRSDTVYVPPCGTWGGNGASRTSSVANTQDVDGGSSQVVYRSFANVSSDEYRGEVRGRGRRGGVSNEFVGGASTRHAGAGFMPSPHLALNPRPHLHPRPHPHPRPQIFF